MKVFNRKKGAMEVSKLKAKVNLLLSWLIITNVVLVFVLYKVFSSHVSLDELTAKRINIEGEDQSLRMVISNENRQHSGRIAGKDIGPRDRPAGIIFFNNEGNESGGLISHVYSGKGRKNSGMSFTMDRYNNDQVIQILNNEIYENGEEKIQRGFLISEFSKGSDFFKLHNEYEEIKKITDKNLRREKTLDLLDREGSKRRIYLGKSFNHDSGLTLYDKQGNPKLKIYVNNSNEPKIEYFHNGSMKNLIQK
jgi:hypothetical protein